MKTFSWGSGLGKHEAPAEVTDAHSWILPMCIRVKRHNECKVQTQNLLMALAQKEKLQYPWNLYHPQTSKMVTLSQTAVDVSFSQKDTVNYSLIWCSTTEFLKVEEHWFHRQAHWKIKICDLLIWGYRELCYTNLAKFKSLCRTSRAFNILMISVKCSIFQTC